MKRIILCSIALLLAACTHKPTDAQVQAVAETCKQQSKTVVISYAPLGTTVDCRKP